MAFKFFVLLACVAVSVSVANAQLGRTSNNFNFDIDLGLEEEKPVEPPIPILRYLDTQNPDGSYTYGYESGDGTYKIETRYPTGEVKGKYGYYDDQGTLREVEYGATPNEGFLPSGSGLNHPNGDALTLPELPQVPQAAPQPIAQPQTSGASFNLDINLDPRAQAPVAPAVDRRVNVVRRRRPQQQQQPAGQQNDLRTQLPAQRRNSFNNFAARRPAVRPTTSPRSFSFTPAPQQGVQPLNLPVPKPAVPRQPQPFRPTQSVQPAQAFRPVQPLAADDSRFLGHPANNINLNDGSYSYKY